MPTTAKTSITQYSRSFLQKIKTSFDVKYGAEDMHFFQDMHELQ